MPYVFYHSRRMELSIQLQSTLYEHMQTQPLPNRSKSWPWADSFSLLWYCLRLLLASASSPEQVYLAALVVIDLSQQTGKHSCCWNGCKIGPVGVLNDHDRIKQYAHNLAGDVFCKSCCFSSFFFFFSQSHPASFRHKERQPNALTLFDYVSLSSPWNFRSAGWINIR